MTRYIALGLQRDIDRWRRDMGVSPRDVIAVSPFLPAGRSLRGQSGDFTLIVFESWRPSLAVAEEVEHHLNIIRATGGTVQ